MIRHRIYVAGRYSAATEEEKLANTLRAIQVGIALVHKGWAPFIPHLTHFVDLQAGHGLTYDDYMLWDEAFLVTCEAFFYDTSSAGADIELARAIHWRQQIYLSVDEVPDLTLCV